MASGIVSFSICMSTDMASVTMGISALHICTKGMLSRMAARLLRPSEHAKSAPIGSTVRA